MMLVPILLGYALAFLWQVSATVISNTLYYSNYSQYNYAVSANNFYATPVDGSNSLGYKAISDDSNTLTTISTVPVGAVMANAAAYSSGSSEIVWSIDLYYNLYCGTATGGLVRSTSPLNPFTKVFDVTVGPPGVWVVNLSSTLYFKSAAQCNVGSSWVNTLISGVFIISSGNTGVYYATDDGIFFLTSPSDTPAAVPSGGPTSVAFMSASTIDDTLVVVDGDGALWILNGPSGSWLEPGLNYSTAVAYDINDFYVYYTGGDGSLDVNFVSLSGA